MTAGCVNGELIDHKAWFCERVGIVMGTDAVDWEAKVLAANFHRELLTPFVVPNLNIDYGVRLQWRSDLTQPPAPRLWLPASGHAYGQYRQFIRRVKEDNDPEPGPRHVWSWDIAPGNEASDEDVIHAPCDGGGTDPNPEPEPEPEPDDDVLTKIYVVLVSINRRLDVLEAKRLHLEGGTAGGFINIPIVLDEVDTLKFA